MSDTSTALIYGNGARLPDELFVALRRDHRLLIAADGGAYNVLSHGATPDLIIGDMDSFTDPAPDGVRLVHDPDQETNDLQKVLNWALAHGITEVVVAGASGDRLDHNLNNLSVLLEFTGRFHSIQLVDGFGRHLVCTTSITLHTRPGLIVSLFPLSGRTTGVVTSGLRYPLANEDLAVGERTGCLNEATGDTVTVRLRSGALLVSAAHS